MPRAESAADGRFNRLLLIDDEPGIRRMMSLDLEADGYEVVTAADGRSGLDVFAKQDFDIVLTDVKMPGLDGLEVLSRIKEQRPETEVIVITGHGDMITAVQALKRRAGDFVTKPIADEALAVALDRAKERLRIQAELADYTNRLEERVEEASRELLQAERLAAVGRTVASVAHSVKNMLSGLRGGSYMIREGLDSGKEETARTGLEMLDRNVGLIKEFVRNLLTLAKPRDPDREPIDALTLLEEAVEVALAGAEAKEVEIIAAEPAPGEAGITILAERPALLDALLNLISNAVDAAASVASGRVEVSLARRDGEAVFQVTDNGPGLDEEGEAQVFTGFFSTKGAAGTGLGLMVANKTAQEHGGRIELTNRPGLGATFRFIVPAAGAEGREPGQPSEPKQED